MLKLRRSINQTLQGTPPSCESPRILRLAPCVPPEDVPLTRIPRTARDGAQSVKPLAKPMGAAGARVSPSRCASTCRTRPSRKELFHGIERFHICMLMSVFTFACSSNRKHLCLVPQRISSSTGHSHDCVHRYVKVPTPRDNATGICVNFTRARILTDRLRLEPFSTLAARARQVTVTVPRGIPEQDTLSRVGHYPFCRLRKHSLRAKLLSFTRELLLVGTRWDSSLCDPLSSWTPTVAFHASWRPCAATPRRARTAAGS